MTIYGVDPGKEGVVAALLTDGTAAFHRLVWDDNNFLDFRALNAFLHDTSGAPVDGYSTAFLERPLMASLNRSTQSIVNTGICYGRLSAVFEHSNIPVRELSPQEWQKLLGLKFTRGESKLAVEAWAKVRHPAYHTPFKTKAANLGARDALGIAMAGKKLLEMTE